MSEGFIHGIGTIFRAKQSSLAPQALGTMATLAALAALDDCGLSIRRVQAPSCGNVMRDPHLRGA